MIVTRIFGCKAFPLAVSTACSRGVHLFRAGAASSDNLLPTKLLVSRNFGTVSKKDTSCWNERGNVVTDYGVNMNQEDLMETDMLLAVDMNDNLIPGVHLTKRDGHSFHQDKPRALLHRAFSFFLFNEKGEMLLTKRAASKITFPNVWTNTCCSHPLYGMKPDEVDDAAQAHPIYPGIKNAVTRKVLHELGIDPTYINHNKIQFISRFHYWAADTITYGKDTPWGEHEIDYILFLQSDSTIPVRPNPDEVQDCMYVSIEELRSMLQQPGLLWSPWFVGIMDRGGWDWWADLRGALAGAYTNNQIIFFDPPPEHVASYNTPAHDRRTGVITF